MNYSTEYEVIDYLEEMARIDDKTHKRLYHYTTFESVLSIIKNRSFQLTRTDFLNDKAEMRIGDKEIASHNYIMSMTERTEYISMWAMYGRPSGIKIRLDFSKIEFLKIINELSFCPDGYIPSLDTNHEGILQRPTFLSPNLFGLPQKKLLRFAYVAYLDKEKKRLKLKGRQTHHFIEDTSIYPLTGLVKYDAWEFEKEIRLLIHLPNNSLKHIFLQISDDLVNSFTITYNPWMSANMKAVIKEELNSVANRELKYRDSLNSGEVDEKFI